MDTLGLRPNWTEKYSEEGRSWDTLDLSQTDMPDIVRSSAVGMFNNKPALIGGASCTIGPGGQAQCTRANTVYTTNVDPNGSDDSRKWVNAGAAKISTPRSSHLVIVVPHTIKFKCDRVSP